MWEYVWRDRRGRRVTEEAMTSVIERLHVTAEEPLNPTPLNTAKCIFWGLRNSQDGGHPLASISFLGSLHTLCNRKILAF